MTKKMEKEKNSMEYLNDKKNGKGKEYKYEQLVFEGEFINNEKLNGKFYGQNNDTYEFKYNTKILVNKLFKVLSFPHYFIK